MNGNMLRHETRATPPPARRGGIAMLAVLIVVAMISLAGLSFVALLSAENKAIRVHGDDVQMEHLLASGEELVKAFLALPGQTQEENGGAYDNPNLFRDVWVVDNPKTRLRGWFSVVAPRRENGEVRGVRFGLESESARLHLALVMKWELQQPGAGRQALLKLPGMTPATADSILDWMDNDSQTREFGAEADYYSGRGLPYGPRNGVPVSLEELLLVRGVTRDLLYGSDTNFNHLLDPGEGANYADRLESLRSGGLTEWSGLLTVHSAERNLTPEGRPRINLNDPDLGLLYQQLMQVFGFRMADFVIAYRQLGPYQGPPLPALPGSIPPDPTLPAKFNFGSVLDLVGVQIRIRIPLSGVYAILSSPLEVDRRAMQEFLPHLLDYTTVEPAEVIVGRVNVNLAPPSVLLCVPGVDESLMSRIVAARQAPDEILTPEHRYPTWLYLEGLVSLEQMRYLLPNITTGGDVYRAQIVGYYDRAGPSGRAESVIDATGRQPRQLYWKDLRILGRGYPAEVVGPPAPR